MLPSCATANLPITLQSPPTSAPGFLVQSRSPSIFIRHPTSDVLVRFPLVIMVSFSPKAILILPYCDCMVLAKTPFLTVISPCAVSVAPVTIPNTVMAFPAVTENPSCTLPLMRTSPRKFILPVFTSMSDEIWNVVSTLNLPPLYTRFPLSAANSLVPSAESTVFEPCGTSGGLPGRGAIT